MSEWCKNYTGTMKEKCDAGIRYEDLKPRGPAWLKHLPCFVENVCIQTCQHREFPTPAEIEERKRLLRLRYDNLRSALVAIIDKRGKERGVQGTIECPACKGILAYSIASVNGHIWASCETKGCLSWIQ